MTVDAFLSRVWVRYGRSRSRHRYRQREVQSVAEDRSGQGNRPRKRKRRAGGILMVPVEMPRYTSFNRKAGCRYLSAALGENLPQDELIAVAKVWNDRLDAWKAERPRHAAGRDAIKIRHCRMALERLPEARSRPPDLGSRTSGSWRKDFLRPTSIR